MRKARNAIAAVMIAAAGFAAGLSATAMASPAGQWHEIKVPTWLHATWEPKFTKCGGKSGEAIWTHYGRYAVIACSTGPIVRG